MIKKVAVFNDLSGFGKCSLTAAIPVLSALGIGCHPVATAVLTGQSGYPVHYATDLTDMLPDYEKAWKQNGESFDGIYTGYLTGPKQADSIFQFLDTFYKKDTFFLADPVMGDNGKVYGIYSDELLEQMRRLSAKADMVTPNLTEACLLAGVDFSEIDAETDTQRKLEKVEAVGEMLLSRAEKEQKVIITGIKVHEGTQKKVFNLAMDENGVSEFYSGLFERSFSGTGDLFASCMCGLTLNGHTMQKSIEITMDFLLKGIRDAIKEDIPSNDGIPFETYLPDLLKEGRKL